MGSPGVCRPFSGHSLSHEICARSHDFFGLESRQRLPFHCSLLVEYEITLVYGAVRRSLQTSKKPDSALPIELTPFRAIGFGIKL